MAVTDPQSPASGRREKLVELYRELQDCRKCPLAEGRNTVVFGTPAVIVFFVIYVVT